jgi:hypothetical protein
VDDVDVDRLHGGSRCSNDDRPLAERRALSALARLLRGPYSTFPPIRNGPEKGPLQPDLSASFARTVQGGRASANREHPSRARVRS